VAEFVEDCADAISPSHVQVCWVAVMSVEFWMEQDLSADDGVEGTYAEASFFGLGQPIEARRYGLPMRWDRTEEEDFVEEFDQMYHLYARHALAHVLSSQIGIPGLQEALEAKYVQVLFRCALNIRLVEPCSMVPDQSHGFVLAVKSQVQLWEGNSRCMIRSPEASQCLIRTLLVVAYRPV
jgi:hypothetical protein